MHEGIILWPSKFDKNVLLRLIHVQLIFISGRMLPLVKLIHPKSRLGSTSGTL